MSETTINPEVIEEINDIPVEKEVKKPYKFRRLNATDVFVMFKIIGAIGINEFTACFVENDAVVKTLGKIFAEKKEGEEESDDPVSIVGVSVVLEIANVVLNNLPKCEREIYQLLAQTTNSSVEKIQKMDFVVFFEMIIDFIKKEEFKDFIKVVSKLF